MKTDLVIIPSGKSALFQDWEDYSNFNFDVAILNWSGEELRNTKHATYIQNFPGHKWHLIYKFASEHDLSNYRYIMCLDDDVVTSPQLLEATFDFCQENNIDIGQPALLPTPHPWGHPPTGCIERAKMHITNWAEIMCPIFSQRCWPEAIALCGQMPLGIGYGLETYWEDTFSTQKGTTKFGGIVAVIDQLPVIHSRPFKTMQDWASLGIDPGDDGRWFSSQGFGLGPNRGFKTINIIFE
jgi:hypothetical protein